VLVVGHQPTLGRVAALLVAGQDAEWWIPKGAIWWLSKREKSSGPGVVVRAVMEPDLM